MKTDTDGLPGLRVETASSIIMRSLIHDHMGKFALVIRRDRAAGQATTSAFIDGLAGTMALVVAGGHGSRDEVYAATCKKLREALDRDLQHLGRGT